jgi:hypothetical protein
LISTFDYSTNLTQCDAYTNPLTLSTQQIYSKNVNFLIKGLFVFYELYNGFGYDQAVLSTSKFSICLYLLRVNIVAMSVKVITKLPNSEQSYKGKVKTHNYINRQNQSTTGKL